MRALEKSGLLGVGFRQGIGKIWATAGRGLSGHWENLGYWG